MTFDKEPKILRIPSPGDGRFWEQIEVNGEYKYVIYSSAENNIITKKESVGFDTFFPSMNEDGDSIHYTPMKTPLWMLPGEPLEYGSDEELWDEIKAFVMSHVDYPDERLYDVKTAWIMATWMPELFNVSPYFKYNGVKNVGKTRALEIDQNLCRRAVLCASASDAAIYRLIEQYNVVYLLDETEVARARVWVI